MPVTSDVFCWDNGIGIGELSTVEGNNGFDPMDPSTLLVKSESTGKIVRFRCKDRNFAGEELVSFTYVPRNGDLHKKGISITLFND